jgi:hypothetical protein
MYRLMGIVVVGLVVMVTGTEGFARGGPGGGSGGGGQQRMRNMSGASQYGYGGQMGAMQQQQQMMMIQNRYRMMQSQPGLGNGNMQHARLMNGANAGQMNARGRQAGQDGLAAEGVGQGGVMQQQRLRDGSCAGQGVSGQATGTGQMLQNRQRMGQSGNGNCPNR